jgi:glycosyltransferase involved in cell wall biosynthesis
VPWVVGSGGILVDVTSPQAIAPALYKMLKNSDIYFQCARDASIRAKQIFSVEAIVDMYETEYQRAQKYA